MSVKIANLLKLDARWYVVIAIVLMALLAVRTEGVIVLGHTISICLTACILDFIIISLRDKRVAFPLSALVSGLIISVVLAPIRHFYIYIVPIAAILSKHIIKYRHKHVFNPAGFGLLVADIFSSGLPHFWGLAHTWTGLAAEWTLTVIFGLFLAYKIKKFSLILSFILTTFILCIIHRSYPCIPAPPFFVFFMLPEPKTSPLHLIGKCLYGVIVAVAAMISFVLFPRHDFLILGLMVGNIFGVFLRKAR